MSIYLSDYYLYLLGLLSDCYVSAFLCLLYKKLFLLILVGLYDMRGDKEDFVYFLWIGVLFLWIYKGFLWIEFWIKFWIDGKFSVVCG